jgi:elongator complex protein 1
VPLPKPLPGSNGTEEAPEQLLCAELSWRGDGRYLATNVLWGCPDHCAGSINDGTGNTDAANKMKQQQQQQQRLLHVWDREDGALHATGQAADTLFGPIAWQPNGRHLYAASTAPPLDAAGPPLGLSAGVNARGAPLRAAPHHGGAAAAAAAAASTAATTTAAATGTAVANGAAPEQLEQQQQWPIHGKTNDCSGDAASQHIILFERNGLQHGGFQVPLHLDALTGGRQSLQVNALLWSIDSELLAVVLAPSITTTSSSPAPSMMPQRASEWRLQLWHRSNWHWHLKYERCELTQHLLAAWDETAAGRLHILTGQGGYQVMDVGWDVCVSARGTAAVVDGHQLLITPLR